MRLRDVVLGLLVSAASSACDGEPASVVDLPDAMGGGGTSSLGGGGTGGTGGSGGPPGNGGSAGQDCNSITPTDVGCAARYEEQLRRGCMGFGGTTPMTGACGDGFGWSCRTTPGQVCIYDAQGDVVYGQYCDDQPQRCSGIPFGGSCVTAVVGTGGPSCNVDEIGSPNAGCASADAGDASVGCTTN